ncbi:FtsP/CotA-like multicopper oxidase with cupredoxin domain [Pseudarthrobacter defluvii]|uniref:multicopper oxidase family protein n=1 Tax=Pseudarthrobacter defluvii TaxID=410837 RepID=UPI00278423EE|nr:multicopper oxidase family protein [Pseudarthrobacter defluvii]MDQ0767923.1 FtsP/CotA-like multicopper oxidase with cupredoxin domain [Pseudarthrobacter defluvii]
MRPISRRQALLLGGLGAAATAAGGAGLVWSLSSRPAPLIGSGLVQPEELHSESGLLQVRLEAAPGQLQLAGREVSALGYNGSIPGPTLRFRAGDTLKITLANSLSQPTNLHVHGLHVSPDNNGDNVFVTVTPGSSFDYEYRLPGNHPPGLYWYHPHHHGMVADQVFAGLFGAIIVEDPQGIETSAERVLVVSDTSVDQLGGIRAASAMDRMAGREGDLLLVNGQSNPEFSALPGQRERWRIVNACVARYLRLRLDGQYLQLLGQDSGRFEKPQDVDEVLLAPGNRADLLVTAAAGESVLRSFRYNRGTMAGMMGAGPAPGSAVEGTEGTVLATFRVAGEPAAPPPGIPRQQSPADLRQAPVAARRQIIRSAGMGMGGGGMMRFTINGREFDASRTDTTAAAGSVEEWTLINTSPMDHPFHLHVWPMQVIGDSGGSPEWRDVVNIHANGQVKVRVAFADFRGRSAYHCHILDHEDLGMMGVIEVL